MDKLRLNTLKGALFFVVGILSLTTVFGQDNEQTLFSGIVFNSEALTTPLPQVNIVVNKTKGTSSADDGAFSILVNANDTIIFSHIGYHSTTVFIPDSVKGGKLIARIFLVSDTVNIKQVVVNSMQDYTEFKDSFMKMENNK